MRTMERVMGDDRIGVAEIPAPAWLMLIGVVAGALKRSRLIFMAATARRRSWATGWRRAIMRIALRSMSQL